jgi:hypothetical protein
MSIEFQCAVLHRLVITLTLAIALVGPAWAGEDKPTGKAEPEPPICPILESAAIASGIPVSFFTRVIWRESRFNATAVGPRTRSGMRAEGIAQFMPPTAAERQLADPFDPVQALPKAAAFLRELADELGNLGLAAAAYNAGPQRVRDWLNGDRSLPAETRAYVLAVTGRSVADWADADSVSLRGSASCATIIASLGTPGAFADALERRVAEAIGKPWGVQLAAGFSRTRVLSRYAQAMERLAPIIGDQAPVIARSLLRSRGTDPFYQARVGAETRREAERLCTRIHHAGAACLVLRNRRAP